VISQYNTAHDSTVLFAEEPDACYTALYQSV
jgi:hypothetical protein